MAEAVKDEPPSSASLVIESSTRRETEPTASAMQETDPSDPQEAEPSAMQETEPSATQETEPSATQETEPLAMQETEPSTNDFALSSEDLRKELACKMCHKLRKNQHMYTCAEGHEACEACIIDKHTCQTCDKGFPSPLIRSIGTEHFIAKFMKADDKKEIITISDLKKELSCKICFNIRKESTINLCLYGHEICSDCYLRIYVQRKKCPQCRGAFPDITTRSRITERLIDKFCKTLRCLNEGCDGVCVEDHHACVHRKVMCPICKHIYKFRDLLEHITRSEVKEIRTIHFRDGISGFGSFYFIGNLNDYPRKGHKRYSVFSNADNETFILCIGCDGSDYFAWFYLMGSKSQADRYVSKIRFSGKNTDSILTENGKMPIMTGSGEEPVMTGKVYPIDNFQVNLREVEAKISGKLCKQMLYKGDGSVNKIKISFEVNRITEDGVNLPIRSLSCLKPGCCVGHIEDNQTCVHRKVLCPNCKNLCKFKDLLEHIRRYHKNIKIRNISVRDGFSKCVTASFTYHLVNDYPKKWNQWSCVYSNGDTEAFIFYMVCDGSDYFAWFYIMGNKSQADRYVSKIRFSGKNTDSILTENGSGEEHVITGKVYPIDNFQVNLREVPAKISGTLCEQMLYKGEGDDSVPRILVSFEVICVTKDEENHAGDIARESLAAQVKRRRID